MYVCSLSTRERGTVSRLAARADGSLGRHLPEVCPHRAPVRLFSLPAALVQPLNKVAGAVQQGDGYHRYSHVVGRTKGR